MRRKGGPWLSQWWKLDKGMLDRLLWHGLFSCELYVYNTVSSGCEYSTVCRVCTTTCLHSNQTWLEHPETEFMNVQLRWGFWAQSWEFQTWGFRIQCLHYKLVSNHFCSRGGSKIRCRGDCDSKEETLSQLCPRIRPQYSSVPMPSPWSCPHI
jgi:hypothetical protein